LGSRPERITPEIELLAVSASRQRELHAAQIRRQKEFLRSIGVPDLSPEEVARASTRVS
jgi:hypothetical protein